jgi:phage replication O-like protein O
LKVRTNYPPKPKAKTSPAEGPRYQKQLPGGAAPIPAESHKEPAEKPGRPTSLQQSQKGPADPNTLAGRGPYGPHATLENPSTSGLSKETTGRRAGKAVQHRAGEARGASPQAEHGHVDLANEIVEALAKTNLSPYESRILWVVWRKTYGWHKKADRISITQFQEMSGLKRRHTQRALKKLIDRKIVTRLGYGRIATYQFQKDYTKWRNPDRLQQQSAPKEVTDRNLKRCPQKKITKENTLGGISDQISTLVSKLFPSLEERKLYDQMIEAISSTRKGGRISASVILAQLKAWEKYQASQVHAGIRIYLGKERHREGKDEKYLLGIIKNQRPGEAGHRQERVRPPGSGSALYDRALKDFYANQRRVIDSPMGVSRGGIN